MEIQGFIIRAGDPLQEPGKSLASPAAGYTHLLSNAPFSKALAAIAIANLFALVALNGFALPTHAILWVLPIGLAAGYGLMRGVRWRTPRLVLPRVAMWMLLAWVLLLTAPRLPYLLQRVPEAHILATGDDHGRLAELVSLTRSSHYPVLHPSNQDYLLSHYYAAFLPMAWLQFAVPALNLKECILLGNLLYHLLMAGMLLEFAERYFRTSRAALAFLFLMTFFGGLDWVTTLPRLFDHHEHWFRHWFGEWREVSAIYTVTWWAVHHALGLWMLLLSYVLLRHARWEARWRKPFVVGLLMLSALYSSVFVLVSLPFVAPRAVWRVGMRLLRNCLGFLLLAIALVPAFLFFGRLTGPAFALAWPRPWPILVFLAGALLLEFALLPLLAGKDERMRGAWLFFASSLFVSSIGLNNYTMRGMLLPTMVLFVCVAPRLAAISWRSPVAVLAIGLTVAGVFREAAWLSYRPLEASPLYWRFTGRPMPEFAERRMRDLRGLDRFNREEFISGTPIQEMDFNETELLRLPRQGFLR